MPSELKKKALCFVVSAASAGAFVYLLFPESDYVETGRQASDVAFGGIASGRSYSPAGSGSPRGASALPEAWSDAEVGVAEVVDDDLSSVLRDALSLDDVVVRNRAVRRIAAVWARRDPEAALAEVPTLPEALRTTFRSA